MKTFGVWCLFFALLVPNNAANVQVGNVPSPLLQQRTGSSMPKSFYSSSQSVTSPGTMMFPPYPPSGGQYLPSGGQYLPSGGQYLPSGGSYSPSGGQFSPSGGQFSPSGGQFSPSGGYYPVPPPPLPFPRPSLLGSLIRFVRNVVVRAISWPLRIFRAILRFVMTIFGYYTPVIPYPNPYPIYPDTSSQIIVGSSVPNRRLATSGYP